MTTSNPVAQQLRNMAATTGLDAVAETLLAGAAEIERLSATAPMTQAQRDEIAKDNTVEGYHGDYYLYDGIIDDVENFYGIAKK